MLPIESWCGCIPTGVDETARYQNEIHALLQVLFPEFTRVFADPCRPTALALLQHYPSARAFVEAGAESLTQLLRELAPYHYGRHTAEQLVTLAQESVSSGRATAARTASLKILCDQLAHTQHNLAQLEREIDALTRAGSRSKSAARGAGMGGQNHCGAAR